MAERLRHRLAGKWQIPLFVCSLGLLIASLFRLRPEPPGPEPLSQRLAKLQHLVEEKLHQRAIGVAKSLLKRDDVDDDHRAFIHLQLARSRFAEVIRLDRMDAQVGRTIADHYAQAFQLPGHFEAADHERWGRALEWQEQYADAITHYEVALDADETQRASLLRHIIGLRETYLGATAAQIAADLDRMLAMADTSNPELVLWSLERKLECLDELNRLSEGEALLMAHRERFSEAPLSHRFDYLEGWRLFQSGRAQEAEAHLRTLQRRIRDDDQTYAKAGWLLGRLALTDEKSARATEALSFFDDALLHHFTGPYGTAIRLGRAESLAALARHVEAIDAFRRVVEEVPRWTGRVPVDRSLVRSALAVRSEEARQAHDLFPALEYARLAANLAEPGNGEQASMFLHQLAQTQTLVAEHLERTAREAQDRGDPGAAILLSDAQGMFADAAATFAELALASTLNDRRSADAAWLAAELYARAGQHERAANLYRSYADGRPGDSLTPRALLRLGQCYQDMGAPSKAIDAFSECFRRFPRSVDGMGSLVPLARSYLSLGPAYEREAIRALERILEDSEIFTPRAPAFADALFLLGEVQNRRGEFDRAIEALQEAVARYPDDARVARSLYFLGDSYRRSARLIREQLKDARSSTLADDMRDRLTVRMREAQDYFRRLVKEYEKNENAPLSRLDEMYVRHAYLYQADCAFDLGDYRRALRLYEEAAGRFQRSITALAAHRQIVHCYVYLGEPAEARSALARARVLVDALPDEAFAKNVFGETREDWRDYFAWAQETGLF